MAFDISEKNKMIVQQTKGRYGRDFSLDTSGFSASCYRKNHRNCSGSKGQKNICTCDCHVTK